ncbi:unnamed protein product [Closterium sp. Yama58-4]|nr:unnamed protein product [Closterium sp. Yama58-4]
MTLADDELLLVADELQLDDLPNVSLPADPPTDDAPAPKKLCTQGDASDNVPAPSPSAPLVPNNSGQLPNAHALPAAPLATTVAPPPSAAPPIPPAFAAPSAAPAPSRSMADPPRQRAPAVASDAPEDQADHADTLAISRNLRRQRAAISIPVMPRRRLAVVEILFPEAGAEGIRADLITRISKHLQPFHFRNNAIPEFQPSVGEVLRIPRRAYARLCFSWPSQDDAEDFKSLFPHTFHLPNSRSVLLKVYVDRNPRFTSAKAGGAATLTLRNIPPGYTPEDIRTFLLHQDVAGDFNSVVLPSDRNRPLHGHERNEAAAVEALMTEHSLVDTFRALHPNATVYSYYGRPRATPRPVAPRPVPTASAVLTPAAFTPTPPRSAAPPFMVHPPAAPPPASRLDRMYISASFQNRLAASPYLLTPLIISDHCYAPLCSIAFELPSRAPRPWRLSPSLLSRPYIATILEELIPALPPSPSSEEWDAWKNALTLRLKRFSNQEKRRVHKTLEHLNHLINQFQLRSAISPLDAESAARLCHREMGISSLLAGINSRIKASFISSITLPNGQSISDLHTMTSACSSFFQSLYSGVPSASPNPDFWRHIPRSSPPPALTSALAAPFSLPEVGKALGQLSRGKTPGPDGLPGELFRLYKPRFAPAFLTLLAPASMPPSLPPSMLSGRTVLIPKKGNASLLDNHRPITLMNADYKVLALCLANRLQRLLPLIIHPSQTAFIKHRKIGDTINDTLDIMDWASFTNSPLLALTVDFRKAYDLLNRPFLFQALSHLGVPENLIKWIRLMHSNTSARISVNNMDGAPFPVRTGVRQGCPLAPLLFVCAIEILHRYMTLYLPGFPLSATNNRLMACYADDVTLFLSSNKELETATTHLMIFAAVSGERPNWSKCSIIPFNIPNCLITHAGQIPIRASNEAERILGIFVDKSLSNTTTWTTTLSRIERSTRFLAALRATATCRKTLASTFLNLVISYPGRFQPPPPDILARLDTVVSTFLSSSRFKETGFAMPIIPYRILYNSTRHGGLGATRPSIQIKALTIQRALRRFGATPSEEVARCAISLPFGSHAFLSHKLILSANYLPPSIPPRALAELKDFLSLPSTVAPPLISSLCLLAEPTAFNRFILKPNGRPFGTTKHERFLLSEKIRLGDIIQVSIVGLGPIPENVLATKYPRIDPKTCYPVICMVLEALPKPWQDEILAPSLACPSPGDCFIPSSDLHSPPSLVLQTTSFSPPFTLSATLHRVLPNGFFERNPFGSGIFHIKDVVAVHTQGHWVAGPLHTGAGLGARLDLLRDCVPSLAAIRQLLYTRRPLDHDSRWIHALSSPLPIPLPDHSHTFLREQPSLQRDLLYRFYTRSLPSGSRFLFSKDRGRCSRCSSNEIETISHIFFVCGAAPDVMAALGSVARRHLGCSPPTEHILFPLPSRAGQTAPWSLLVGAAAKALWNARCNQRSNNIVSSRFEILQLILAQFLLAFKIFLWRRSKQSAKQQQKTAPRLRAAKRLRFISFF